MTIETAKRKPTRDKQINTTLDMAQIERVDLGQAAWEGGDTLQWDFRLETIAEVSGFGCTTVMESFTGSQPQNKQLVMVQPTP